MRTFRCFIALLLISNMVSLSSCGRVILKGDGDSSIDNIHDDSQFSITCSAGGFVSINEIAVIDISSDPIGIEDLDIELEEAPLGSIPEVVIDDFHRVEFTFYDAGQYRFIVTAIGTNGETSNCSIAFNAIDPSLEFIAICPEGQLFNYPTTVSLDATVIGGNEPYIYNWQIEDYPEDLPYEDTMVILPETNTLSFELLLEGSYVFRLSVTDSMGHVASCNTSLALEFENRLEIVLKWNAPDRSCTDISDLPDCDPTDLDLHLLNAGIADAWFYIYDCYYVNCIYDNNECMEYWDGEEPYLTRDDRIGYGPEIIEVNNPSFEHSYIIGIHRYKNTVSPYLPFDVAANIDIICNDYLEYSTGAIDINATDDFVVVAVVQWASDHCTVEPTLSSSGAFYTMTRIEAESTVW